MRAPPRGGIDIEMRGWEPRLGMRGRPVPSTHVQIAAPAGIKASVVRGRRALAKHDPNPRVWGCGERGPHLAPPHARPLLLPGHFLRRH